MPTELNNKTCEACGEHFGCGARLDGCWCADVKITPESAVDLKASFNDCLCPKCLEKYASASKTDNLTDSLKTSCNSL